MTLKIVLDENIPHAQEIFSPFGVITSLPGRLIKNQDLKDADALIIRSITNVDKNLVENTKLKFIGTCTIGTDHVKEKDLEDKNIKFFSAPGCNAQSVAEYVLAVLLDFSSKTKNPLKGKSIGVVGVGNVGTLVAQYAKQLDMEVLLNDPPRERKGDPLTFVPFEKILTCDFITLHVPLNKQGPDKTHYLINEIILKQMKPNAVLINTCRGSVVNNKDLKSALINKVIQAAVLDVWENEPNIDKELFNLCYLGTPHIAGYSYDAKIRGSTMIAEKLAGFFHLKLPDYSQIGLPEEKYLDIGKTENLVENPLKTIVNLFYDPQMDHLHLKNAISSDNLGEYFDNLRKKYRKRREFQVVPLKYNLEMIPDSIVKKLSHLRFRKFI